MRIVNAHGGNMKRSVNLSIQEDLLERARSQGINLSLALENTLRLMIREHARDEWVKENTDAMLQYNEWIDNVGLFNEGDQLV